MSTARAEALSRMLRGARARVNAATKAAGRSDTVQILVVSKTYPASDVRILAGLGCTDFGENKAQEAASKAEELSDLDIRWHMIGQIQRNKAKSISTWANVVESVDRASIIPLLAAGNSPTEVLIQVSLDDPTIEGRGGADPAQAVELAHMVAETEHLTIMGVMGVAPYPGDPVRAFARLRDVSQRIQEEYPHARMISAGMSQDLEQAIASGATQVRLGSAILGNRTYVQ